MGTGARATTTFDAAPERGEALRALLEASERWVLATQTTKVSDSAADDLKRAALQYAHACGWLPPEPPRPSDGRAA